MSMEKKNYLPFCRYYKGEDKNPYNGNAAAFWDYERIWIEHNFTENGKTSLAEYLDDFSRAGLALFEMNDDTPASLKALLFNRFCHWRSASMIECVEPFKDFYKREYYDNNKGS